MNKHLFLIVLLIVQTAHAQFGPQQIISTEANGTRSISVIDIDGDNLVDVVSANKFGSSITWFKNLDGSSFGPQLSVATINQPISVNAADIDGDNDMDILSLSSPDDLIVWYENIDGLGTFSEQRIIYSDDEIPNTVIAADVNGDSYMDVVVGSDYLGLYWFENLDGLGNFGARRVVNSTILNARSVVASDIDGDNDLDIISSSSGSVRVSWFRNLDGQGNFGSQQTISTTNGTPETVFAADLDGDNDNDVISADPIFDKVFWHENMDITHTFGNENIVTTQVDAPISVYAVDLDNDEDIDILSASGIDGKIAWYENLDGLGNLGVQQIITTNNLSPRDVCAADIDNDGDQDVFSASTNDDKIAWYENLTFVGIEENELIQISLSPNPVENILYITTEEIVSQVKMHDLQGRLLLQKDSSTSFIEMTRLPSGMYLVEVITDRGSLVKKVVKK